MKAVSSAVISIALLGVLSLPAQADSGAHDMPGMKDHKMSDHRHDDCRYEKIDLRAFHINSSDWRRY